MALFNLARMTVTSTGQGTITLNAAVSGFLTFDTAGCSTAATGQALTYAIADGTTASEIASGTYYSSALAVTRGSSTSGLKSTNGNSPINMTSAAQVFIAAQANGIMGKLNIQTFTANGTYTPTTGLIAASIECIGGGGGGGGADGSAAQAYCGGGGGGGGYSRTVSVSSAIGTSQTVTIGAGGAGGAAGAFSGSSGSNTSVGTLCIGIGGSGGHYSATLTAPTGGAGGVAGTGTYTAVGQPGGFGWIDTEITNNFVPSGAGGNSHYGPGAASAYVGVATTPANGTAATANTGGGGSGGGSYDAEDTASGGNGGSGVVIITELCSL